MDESSRRGEHQCYVEEQLFGIRGDTTMTNKAAVIEPTMRIHREAGVSFYLTPKPTGVEAVVREGVETPYTVQSLGNGHIRVAKALPGLRGDTRCTHNDFRCWDLAASFIVKSILEDDARQLDALSEELEDHWEEMDAFADDDIPYFYLGEQFDNCSDWQTRMDHRASHH